MRKIQYSINRSFDDLYQVKKADPYTRVKRVLLSKDEDLEKQGIASTVLFIVFRLRNNLLHGNKLSQLKDQLDNFRCANCVLKRAIEIWHVWDQRRLIA